ncbi:hypothetical protein BL250_02695 [Erwinia sp. OLTSP20]|uniref:PAS domain-containing protein n=1 Tax=unclassified Erwinia TaxID=2622719 RepID=UPI000C174DBB|nr:MULTISPECIES: PAS domain-containing protein [unclassified Erwinia]PIJ51890.1 hypothetical protein BV501_01595 [Erwinia sp. OAMSP11]PIJ74764.1 hypothetical protein BK416_02930 [Erwinia sp. OLSSP12]PIJ85150.1 hypothetical protein BLD47_00670 [Erwinia sp. OLCASP19]PIJ87151.1 hypothetical protein BLD46_01065 [Erwinia sp. OLMTSP26]PIJ88295.1 hypothetical protein BLD49_02120 [Erwinia sp. OLMDSP33]
MRRHHLPEESAFIFKQVVQHSANAIFLTDSEQLLTFANEAGEALFLRLQQNQQLPALLSAAHLRFEVNDGQQPHWLRCQVARLDDPRYSGFLVIANDITAELHAQCEEAHLRWRLEQTMEITEEGFWFWDMQRNEVSHNHFWQQIFGLQDGALTHPVCTLEKLIHPEDRDEVKRQLREHLRGHTPMFNCQYRIITPHAEIRWIHNTGKAVRHDGKGMATEMVGKAKDGDASN